MTLPSLPALSTPSPPVKNKGGRPKRPVGSFADPGPRAIALVEKFGAAQILEWYAMIDKGEAKKIPLGTGDILLLGRIARSIKDGVELERFYDRSFGKVPDRNINMNVNIEADPEKLSERAADMLSRLIE